MITTWPVSSCMHICQNEAKIRVIKYEMLIKIATYNETHQGKLPGFGICSIYRHITDALSVG